MGVLAAVCVPYIRSVTLFFVLAYLYSIPSVEKVTGRAAAARAVTGSSSAHRHRHSARPSSRFQTLMIISPLQGCGAGPHHNAFYLPPDLTAAVRFV